MNLLSLLLLCALVLVVSFLVGKWLFKKDDKWERIAESLLDLSAALQEYGLVDIPRALRLVAIKDFSGAWEIVKYYLQLLKRDPTAVIGEFDKVFERVLAVKLAKRESAVALKAQVDAAVGTEDKTAKVAA